MLIGGVSGVFGSSLVRLIILTVGALVVIFWLFVPSVPSRLSNPFLSHGNEHYDTNNPNQTAALLAEKQNEFWNKLQLVLAGTAPGCPSPVKNGSSGAIGFNAVDPPERTDLIQMPEMDVLKMREAHGGFLNETRTQGLWPPYVPETRGLVYTAGGKYLPVFVASLRMLRRTNSKLPVEVFLKDKSEYEDAICNGVLPGLNAKCVVLSEILGRASGSSSNGTNTAEVQIEHYQLKVFAMLFSSFEDILWLDADCFPLYDPEALFDSEPYKSNGLVAWPDYWASTVSPQYYLIAQVPVPPMNARASSETGEFMISKKTHGLTLILSTYYNYYGPSHYFALLSQGAPGEGDKETFLQAASAAGNKFYAVNEPVGAVGHKTQKGGISGSAMIQYDPVQDFKLRLQHSDQPVFNMNDIPIAERPRVYFIHAHFPKFNPATIFENKVTKPTYKPDGSYGRAWVAPDNTLQRFGRDVEREFWKEIKWMSCTLEDKFKSWQGVENICKRVTDYWEKVFEKSTDPVPQFKFDPA